MDFWVWLVVDSGILICGSIWLGYLVWQLKYSSKKIAQELQPVLTQIEQIDGKLATRELYSKPQTNIDDDPLALTSRWLQLKGVREHKREAKKRRLVSRLSSRK